MGGDPTRKKREGRRRVTIQEFQATRDAVDDMIKRMIEVEGRLDNVEDRLKRLEEIARALKLEEKTQP